MKINVEEIYPAGQSEKLGIFKEKDKISIETSEKIAENRIPF